MENQPVIVEFSEREQQIHFNFNTVAQNSNGYQTLQNFSNPDEAHFICEFLETILEAKQEMVTFGEMKMLSNGARKLLSNYNEAILNAPVMN